MCSGRAAVGWFDVIELSRLCFSSVSSRVCVRQSAISVWNFVQRGALLIFSKFKSKNISSIVIKGELFLVVLMINCY